MAIPGELTLGKMGPNGSQGGVNPLTLMERLGFYIYRCSVVSVSVTHSFFVIIEFEVTLSHFSCFRVL